MKKANFNKGIAIPTVLFVLVIVTLIAFAAQALTTQDLKLASKCLQDTQAFYAAEAGLSVAIDKIRTDTAWTGVANGRQTFCGEKVMPGSAGTYTVWVCNRLDKSNQQAIPQEIKEVLGANAESIISEGSCYILAEGKVGSYSSRKVGALLKGSASSESPSSGSEGFPFQYAVFGYEGVGMTHNTHVDSYELQNDGTGSWRSKRWVLANTGGVGANTGSVSLGRLSLVLGGIFLGPDTAAGTGAATAGSAQTKASGGVFSLSAPLPKPDVVVPSGLPVRTIAGSPTKTINSFVQPKQLRPGRYNEPILLNASGSTAKHILLMSEVGSDNTFVFTGIEVGSQSNILVDVTNGPIRVIIDDPNPADPNTGNIKFNSGSFGMVLFNFYKNASDPENSINRVMVREGNWDKIPQVATSTEKISMTSNQITPIMSSVNGVVQPYSWQGAQSFVYKDGTGPAVATASINFADGVASSTVTTVPSAHGSVEDQASASDDYFTYTHSLAGTSWTKQQGYQYLWMKPSDLLIQSNAVNKTVSIDTYVACAGLYAPNSNISLKNRTAIFGSVIGKRVDMDNFADVNFEVNMRNKNLDGSTREGAEEEEEGPVTPMVVSRQRF
jgi:Tfp pilus assembly protein PilX